MTTKREFRGRKQRRIFFFCSRLIAIKSLNKEKKIRLKLVWNYFGLKFNLSYMYDKYIWYAHLWEKQHATHSEEPQVKQKEKQHTGKGWIQLHVATDQSITTYQRHAYHTSPSIIGMQTVQGATATYPLTCIAGL